MSELIDTGSAPPAPEAPGQSQSTETVTPSGSDSLSIREASRELSGYREKRDGTTEAPPTEELGEADREYDARSAETTEEPAEQSQPDEQSHIEAPRSWSKEEKERFNSLPRETQEYLTRRENERDTALRRGQNEAATQRKGLEERERAVEQMRQQYEQALPVLMQQLQQQQMGEFADIRTQQDVDNMARNDWQRFAMWQAHQMKVQNLNQQMTANYQRQQQEYTAKWNQFAQNEDSLFTADMPEMNDPVQAKEIATQSVTLLRDTGFSDDDLNKLWSGQASVSLRDNRIQKIIVKAARYDAAKAGVPAKRAALPASRTLRPGTPAERASDAQVNLDSLTKNLETTGKWKDGAELLLARRAARRR